MAKVSNNDILDKSVDWSLDPSNNLPYSGRAVQKFIKEQLNGKAGVFYYDTSNNRYLVFTDTATRDEYLLDPTQTELILGTFDAPFNYSAEITLESPSYNAVFLGSTGNYIDFTFDVKNKQGASTGENVTVTYTFIRNATKVVIKETRKYGDSVHFNVDNYIDEGTNTIIVGVTGQTSLAATTVAVTYQVVNLSLADATDISVGYSLTSGAQVMEVPFTVSGYGTKIVEWYLDGVLLDFVKAEDEVVDVTTSRVKYITLSNLQQGRHSLQIRAYTVINGENFYTDTLYRDVLVYTGANTDVLIGVAVTIPRVYGILDSSVSVGIYDMVQYVPYTLNFATYSPTNASNTEVTIKLDGEIKGTVGSVNGTVNEFALVSTTAGNKTLTLEAGSVSYTLPVVVDETTMNLEEITNGLVLDFNALNKTNNSSDRGEWSYGDYTGTLTGFNWNNTSGWVDGRLEMSAGSSFGINLAPLADNPTSTGKTIEIEWSTKNVSNDNAIICDLRNSSGVGILITATKVSMTSADGVVVETEYKSDENVRVGFVINRSSGTTNQRLSFIYANGIVSRCEKWAVTDSYTSDAEFLFTATTEAEISLKSIRVYNVALSNDQMLNNYTIYRDTIEEMMGVYDRNDVYEEGTTTFSPDKMSNRLPVMIVTGDIPTLENTSDKDTQIVVDIDYYNMQDTSKSFRMVGAAMRPQGTSSMGYPKKNFRIYTEKVEGTVVYDAEGNVITDKLYSFKEGAQPVNCWCLKADYAESSGTHNTGIARLWNEALVNAQVNGEYVLRTEAQKQALEAGYEYDVRTAIDGFPILLFYRPTATDDLIFIGKYNFNNDKSTESVFGFEGIPNFDNSNMQCWEILNNGNALALFTTVEGFDSGWSEAFESRYPDTKTPDTTDLKAFCEWMVNVTQEDFATEKWEHLNVYMMAAYWSYLMRHAAADQFVKNAMFTSEDGQHFYFILYDNDTINGLINTGHLRIQPTDDRQTVDASGSYVFAGHDSRLWNMLEADAEFIDIVSTVDNALYSAGISYANTIHIFDDEQANKWVERVYNQDAQYKYIGPYTEKGIDNLFMLQGKRDLHRRWWLAKRFAIYDAKYVSGTYKSQAIEIKCLNNTEAGQSFTVTSGYPLDYGYGINNLPREYGVTLEVGESHTFTTEEVVNLGDPIRIYGAPNIAAADFSAMSDRLAVITIANVYDEALGTKLTRLILGSDSLVNAEVSEISGLKQATALEYLDVQGMEKIISLDLSNHIYFKTLKAFGSGLASVSFSKGAPVESLELPATMRILALEQLPYLQADNIILEDVTNLAGMIITSCPNISSDYDFVYNWVSNKTTANSSCTLTMDNVNWTGISGAELVEIAKIGYDGGTISLKGKVVLTDISEEQGNIFTSVFGDTVYNEDAEFFIDAPTTVTLTGVTSLLEGEGATYTAKVYPPVEGTITYSLPTTRTGCSINETTGKLTTSENGLATSNIVVRATFVASDGSETLTKDLTVSVVKRVYPANATISGNTNPIVNGDYSWSTTTSGITGEYVGTWSLSGDITDYVEITRQDTHSCELIMAFPPVGTINGTLTLTLKKAYNSATILTVTKTLGAYMAGVIITSRTNAPVQSALYGAGLVANEDYTLQSEAQSVTSSQLMTTSTTSIFSGYTATLTHFEEFSYFTGVVSAPVQLFYNCTLLETVTLPNNLVSLGNNIFQNCKALESLELPATLMTIGSSAFSNCTSLTTLEIPEGVTTLGSNVCHGCTNLETIYIPSTVTSTGGNSFGDCGKLNFVVAESNNNYQSIDGVLYNKAGTSIIEYAKDYIQPEYTVESGVTTIGNYCFCDCRYITAVVIPSTVTRLGLGAFSGAINLSDITFKSPTAPTVDNSTTFGDTPSNYVGRNSYSTGENRLRIPINGSGYTYGYWSDPLQSDSKCGFTLHGKLTINSTYSSAKFTVKYTNENGYSVTLNDVGVGIWYLGDVKINSSVIITVTSDGVYDWATKTITYDGEAMSVTNNAYSPLTIGIASNQGTDSTISAVEATVTYGSTTTILGNGESVNIPINTEVSVTFPSVTGYAKPSNVTYTSGIDSKTISVTYSTTIVKVVMADNQASYNDIANATATVTASGISATTVKTNGTVKVPTGVSCTVTWNVLSGYSTPSAQTFTTSGTSVTKTGTYQTEILTVTVTSDIDLPSSYTITVSGVGSQTTASATYKVPFGLTYTVSGSSAAGYATPTAQSFTANSVSRSVTVEYLEKHPAIIATYNVTIASSATQLLYSSYSVSNITTMEVDGVSVTPALTYRFKTTGEHTVKIVASTTQYMFRDIKTLQSAVIEDGITSIDNSTFYNCTSLTSVTIGNGVTSIGQYAFFGCNSLGSVTIPDSVTKINLSAFSSCKSLGSVTIPDSVTKIGYSAFSNCSSLTSVTIGNGVTSIGQYAFSSCDSLRSVTIPDSVTSIGNNIFRDCENLAQFKGKFASKDGKCLIVDGVLNSFAPAGYDEYTIPDGVTSIGINAFYYCRSLTSITIPDSVTSIGSSAFSNCDSLTSITIPDSVTSIGSSAFSSCDSLTSVTIGNGVTSIGGSTFSRCDRLKTIYCLRPTAPSVSNNTFGTSTSTYTGRDTYSTGENMLYVPSGATGYDTSYWLDPLQDSSKCGFTLSATL